MAVRPIVLPRQGPFNVGLVRGEFNSPVRGQLFGDAPVARPVMVFNEASIRVNSENEVISLINQAPTGAAYDLEIVTGDGNQLRRMEPASTRMAGAQNNFYSTPSTPGNTIPGDFQVDFIGALDDFLNGNQVFCSKWGVPSLQGFIFQVSADSSLALFISSTGANSIAGVSPVTGVINGTKHKFTAIHRAVAQTTEFRLDDVPLGAPVAHAVGGMFASTAPVEVSGYGDGDFDTFSGFANLMTLWNGIEGEGGVVASLFDPAEATGAVDPWTSGAGDVWTPAGAVFANVSGNPVTYCNSGAGLQSLLGQVIAPPFTLFMVVKPVVGSTDYYLSGNVDAANDTSIYLNPSDQWAAIAGGVELALVPAGNQEPQIITLQHNGDASTTLTASIDGTATGDIGAEGLAFGNVFTDIAEFNSATGWLGSLHAWPRALDPDEVASVQAFLQDKWL